MSAVDVLILGAGYVGKRLGSHLQAKGLKVALTKRSLDPTDTTVIQFSIDSHDTWRQLPNATTVVFTLPTILPQIESFFQFWKSNHPESTQYLVYGSTSRYKTTVPDQDVDETTELDLSQPRVMGENFLQQHGATVLVLSGIAGPGREPKSWMERGLLKNGNRIANLIHVDDIVQVTDYAIQNPTEFVGQAFNVSNGEVITYSDIAKNTGAPTPPEAPRDLTSRRVVVDKIRQKLPSTWKFKSCSSSPL